MKTGIEISEKKHITAPILNSIEQKLAFLAINTDEPLIIVDADLTIITFNLQFERLYFDIFHKEVVKGRSIVDYAQNQDETALKKIYQKVFSGEVYESEIEIQVPGSELQTLLLKYKPIFEEPGKVIAAFVTSTDISHIKQSQHQLQVSERRFRALVENSSNLVLILNNHCHPSYISSSVSNVLGYTEAEFSQIDLFSLIHYEDVDVVMDTLKEVLKNPGTVSPGYCARMLHKNGTYRWLEAHLSNMLHDVAIEGIVINFNDITEKIIAEREKEFDHNNLNALINNTQDLMWSISTNNKLISSNAAFDNMVQYLSGHAVVKGGDTPTAGFSEENLKRWKELYARAFAGETFTVIEYHSEPQEFWSEISFYPILNGDTIIGTACYSRDITERKLVERRLEQSEKGLKETQKMAGLGSWSYDLKTHKTYWSDQSYDLFALNKDETIPSLELFLSFIHPDDLAWVQTMIREEEKSLKEYSFNCRIIRKDGVMRYMYSDCKFLLDKEGKPYKMQGIMQDVTERKDSEAKLLHSQSRLKQAQALAHVGNWEVNFASNASIWSDEAYRIYGLEPRERGLSFEQWLPFIHSDDLPGFIAEMKSAQDTLSDSVYTHRIIRPDGAIRHVVSESRYEFNSEGKPIGLYGIVRDITEKKLADEEIRIAKERYDIVAKATNDALYDWDLKANTVYRTGDGLKVLFGYHDQSVINEHNFWISRIHPEDYDHCLRTLHSIFADPAKHTCNQEYRFRKADGNYAHVFDKGFIIRDDKGHAIRMIGATQDITRIKESEILLKELNETLEKRAKELVISNSELEQFAYIASHDLQEPLRMVTSFLTQLEKKYKDQLDDKAKQYIHFATDGAIRMRRLILDLLEYSRVGRQTCEKEKTDISELLDEAIKFNRSAIDEKNAVIRYKDLPVVYGNKSRLQQVFQNLISNALKYQKQQAVPVITITGKETDTHWQFSITDNGIGIEEKYFEKIFVVFQRLHNKDEYSGTGIGLAICKKIIESHHGRIWIESTYGAGTTFHFTIAKQCFNNQPTL